MCAVTGYTVFGTACLYEDVLLTYVATLSMGNPAGVGDILIDSVRNLATWLQTNVVFIILFIHHIMISPGFIFHYHMYYQHYEDFSWFSSFVIYGIHILSFNFQYAALSHPS